MAAVPSTATLPHQQAQNTIWEDCPRVQIFCFLCSQMVCSLFVFTGLQKCPLWHGQLVPQTKAESSHWAHSGNSRAFSEPFCAHPMEARGPLLHFQSVFVQLLNNSPAQSLAWLHILLLFDLNEEIIPFCSPTLPLHWKSCTVQYLPELLSISALFSQHSYKHVLISTRDVSVCKYLVNTLKKNQLYHPSPDTPGVITVAKEPTSNSVRLTKYFFSLFLSYTFYLH